MKTGEPLQLQPQFSILIGTDGELTLSSEDHEPLELSRRHGGAQFPSALA